MKKCFKSRDKETDPETLLPFPLQAAIFRQSSIKSAAFSYCQPLVKPKRPCQLRVLGMQAGRKLHRTLSTVGIGGTRGGEGSVQ